MGSRVFVFCILVVPSCVNISLTLATQQNDDLSLQIAELKKQDKDQTAEMLRLETSIDKLKTQTTKQNDELSLEFAKLKKHDKDQSTEMRRLKTSIYGIAKQNDDLKTQLAEQNKVIADQTSLIRKQQTATESLITNTSSGVIFTRWGREDCPVNISTSVYYGTAGGSHFRHSGGAANRICMPRDPIWNNNTNHNSSYWGYVYGAEYESVPDSSLEDYKVPCAVCRATSFSTRIMIPGRNKCYEGWTKAYAGELTSGYHWHSAASEYACLDAQPQKKGNNTNTDGVLFYPVRVRCGALPCEQYQDDKLLTCVVCLK